MTSAKHAGRGRKLASYGPAANFLTWLQAWRGLKSDPLLAQVVSPIADVTLAAEGASHRGVLLQFIHPQEVSFLNSHYGFVVPDVTLIILPT